jgi:hypothetical protein
MQGEKTDASVSCALAPKMRRLLLFVFLSVLVRSSAPQLSFVAQQGDNEDEIVINNLPEVRYNDNDLNL